MVSRLLVVSTFFRVLAILASAQDHGPAATKVFGQPDFAAKAVGHDADGLSFPIGLARDDGGGLYVADRNNNRVLPAVGGLAPLGLAAAWVRHQPWLLALALVVLGEELFETSRNLTAINRSPRRPKGIGHFHA